MSDDIAGSASQEQRADNANNTGNVRQDVVSISTNVDPESDLRVQRIREQVHNALREEDPRQANIDAACAEIHYLQRCVFQLLAPSLSEGEDPKATLEALKSAIEIYIKLGNQGNQYAILGHKYRKSAKGS